MYFDAYLDVCPAFGWVGGPSFETRVITLANGRERRNGNWQQPRNKYAAPYQNISDEDYQKILTMFMVCQGRLHCFRFKDYLNFEAVDQQFGVGDGVQTEFQLTTVFTVSGIPYGRNVYALVGTPVVTVNGTPTAVTVDMDRGRVTFGAPPALSAVLEWSGEFDVWVRFADDDLPFSIDNRSPDAGQIINGSVNLIEVPPPPEGS